jgi:hypothetical protein
MPPTAAQKVGAGASAVGRTAAAQKANQPQAKVTITHSAPTVHQAAQGVVAAGQAAANPKQAQPQAFDPTQALIAGGSGKPPPYTQAQLNAIAARVTQGQTANALTPLQSAAKTINQTQNTVAQRYAGYTQGAMTQLGQLQSDAAAGASSIENQAAQQAQAAATENDRSGAAAQALTGGYVGPLSAAAGQAGATYQGTVQGAEAGTLPALAQSENNYLRSVAATMPGQNLLGQADIASTYGKQLAANQAQQSTLIGQQAAKASDLGNTYGTQQAQQYLLGKEYGIKQQAANQAGQQIRNNFKLGMGKLAIDATNAQTAGYRAKTQAAYQQGQITLGTLRETDKVSAATADRGLRKYIADNNIRIQNDNVALKRLNTKIAAGTATSADKLRAAETKKALASLTTQNSNPTNLKGIAAVLWAKNAYDSATSIPVSRGTNAQGVANPPSTLTPGAARSSILTNTKLQGAQGQAGLELAIYGYISPATQRQLQAQGITPMPAWLNRPNQGGGVSGTYVTPGTVVGGAAAGAAP